MVETKFFTRNDNGLERYKNNFKLALKKVKTINIFSLEVIEFLEKWIEKQTSYIPREDVENFLPNMELIFNNKNFYDFSLKKLTNVSNNGNIIEYSFNLISALDDSKKEFEINEKNRIKKEKLINDELNSKNEDKKKLEEIENILNDL